MTKTSFTFPLSKEQQETLIKLLREGNYAPATVDHTLIAADTKDCRIALYKSGKCLVQGKAAEDFVMYVLEPMVLLEARVGYDEVLTPEVFQPHMGVDESGKGDFFGPMVTCAAYVDHDLVIKMKELNVRDSKLITTDKAATDLARELRKLLKGKYAIVTIGPAAYNRLYSKMRSVNTILAWAHARAIENVLEMVPACPMAISDQFGSKSQVEKALMKEGRKIRLVQRHKAESDPAVAAASILARAAFLDSLKQLAARYAQPFPKGASVAVKERAMQLAGKEGPRVLLDVAKCHFKTTDVVLGGINMNRQALGPEGAAVSKPYKFFQRRKPSAET
ncbi:MAG: ribonuclease HIII [bacterium]